MDQKNWIGRTKTLNSSLGMTQAYLEINLDNGRHQQRSELPLNDFETPKAVAKGSTFGMRGKGYLLG